MPRKVRQKLDRGVGVRKPHNQELGLCLVEDYLKSQAHDRERLLLACAQHTAGHRKYGDHLESYRRFAEAFGLT